MTQTDSDTHAALHDNNLQQEPLVPAVRVPLSGRYLIEASAGTGKTWTLTGIVLRLLIEAKRAPEHIIATTFTRAAAAEMRERIHARLLAFYQLLQWLNTLQAHPDTHPILYPQLLGQPKPADIKTLSAKQEKDPTKANAIAKKPSIEQQQARLEWLEKQAQLAGNADLLADPINRYLLEYLLNHAEDYPLMEAIRRCALVLTTLDKLFIGTLDSLSQKWLSEYSAETGYQQGIQISDQEQIVIEGIIHDAVRAYHSQLHYQQPKLYQLLEHKGLLTRPAEHLQIAKKSLQFMSIPIDRVERGAPINFEAYEHALEVFKSIDLSDIAPYFDKEYRKSQGFHATASLGAKIDRIYHIQSAIEQYGILFFLHLDEATQKFYEALPLAFLTKEEGGKGFNSKKDTERSAFLHLNSIQALKTLHDFTDDIERYLDHLIAILNRDIALQVREKLPAILEARGETTFALQMVRLNQALTGKQGERLARYIRYHYPVALIDESQDINGEQARMLECIYLSKNKASENDSVAKNSSRHFLLLVGDPKQAIYGFRGGDVANYNAMKAQFDSTHIMTLDVNRRSNEALITALNHWFGRPKPMDSANDNNDANHNSAHSDSADTLANLGKDIYYQHITAAKPDTRVSWQMAQNECVTHNGSAAILPRQPVSIIHLPYHKDAKYDHCELTALHIAALLASGQTIEGRPIKPNDIGVLGRTKKDLKQVEDMLTKLAVPTLETAETNIFDTVMAADLIALLEAMLRPQRRDIINRVLTSHFYQLRLDEVQALMLSADNNAERATTEAQKSYYQDFQSYLKIAATYWQHNGILSALHYLFASNPMAEYQSIKNTKRRKSNQSDTKTPQNIWVNLANLTDGARHLMDLRHLMDILAQHGMHIGEHELLAWYKKNMNSSRMPDWAQQQPLPTESGVQLMTIHKSKGLEFPVVYVIGMDNASRKSNDKSGGRNKHNLYLYNHSPIGDNQSVERRLSATEDKVTKSAAKSEDAIGYYAKFETDENYEERRRLAYVAFTRASEQLYIVLADSYSATGHEYKPMLHWLGLLGKDKEFVLPERLQPYIGWLNYDTVETHSEALINAPQQSPQSASDDVMTELPLIDYDAAFKQIKQTAFRGWAKTSFTALSRQLGEQSQALAVFDDSVEDDLDLTDYFAPVNSVVNETGYHLISADDIRFRFIKGANAGTFLHHIFEKIDFNDASKWSAIIDQSVRQYQLPSSYSSADNQQRLQKRLAQGQSATSPPSAIDHQALTAWIADVLAAPLQASGQPLKALAVNQRIAELGFNMGLSKQFTPEAINAVFAKYLPHEPDKHITLTYHYTSHIYRYLRGEIDLVYEYAGKYYMVDYKSNYLGDSLSHYNQSTLNAAMNKAGYWLQAAIYQVALHRFLRLRLPDYEGNESKYLGAVEYVFLRGIDSQHSADNNRYGRISWDIPIDFILALDEMFGLPNKYEE